MQISLYQPKLEDLWFKKSIKEDPKTMDYNAGYDVCFTGYNYNDGTIQTNLDELKKVWFPKWINNWPTNIYFYIKSDNSFAGEIYAKWDKNKEAYEIGIVVKAEYRGKGYASQAISLLCEKMKLLGAKKLYHELPTCRVGAIKADTNNGFVIINENIQGMNKFGKPEMLTYLEKML